MMLQNKATLKTIFSEVLANLAFMFTDEAEDDPSPAQTWLETTVCYQGPVQGRLCFRCTREFAVLLASNLLGIDPEDNVASSQNEDAIKEFVNIVCGQYVTAMHGSERVFNLTIPQTTTMPQPPLIVDDSETICTFSIDSHIVQLTYERLNSGD